MTPEKKLPAWKIILLFLLYFILQLAGQTAAKTAGSNISLINFYTLAGYVFLVLRGLLWVLILSRIRLLAAYPLNGLSYVLILPLSWFVFGEPISPGRTAGSVLILLGVTCFTIAEARSKKEASACD